MTGFFGMRISGYQLRGLRHRNRDASRGTESPMCVSLRLV